MIMNYSATSSSASFPDAQPFIGTVENTVSALRLVQAAKLGIIPRIVRRLNDSERQDLIVPGAVLVFSVEESGIKRWTDGRLWSPSRIVGNFLVYKEMLEKTGSRNQKSHDNPENYPRRGDLQWDADANRLRCAPSRAASSALNGTLKTGGLLKKTITVTIDGTDLHLISYYTQEDVMTGRLKRLSTRPDVATLVLEPRNFRLGNFRNPPKVIKGPDGKSTIVPGAEEAEPHENLTDGLPHRATESADYRVGGADVTPSPTLTSSSHQSMNRDGSSTTSMSHGHTTAWREEYDSVRTMVDQYRQGSHWEATTSSAEAPRADGYLDYRTPDAQGHARRGVDPSWRGSPGVQYPGLYTPSTSDTTVYKQRELARLGDGSDYEERAGLPNLYGNPHNSDQRAHTSQQTQHVGSAYPLGQWSTSRSTSDIPPVLSTTTRSRPTYPRLSLPSTREMYSDGQWSPSSTNEYTVSPLQQQGVQAFPDPGQTYYYRAPIQEGAGRHYEVEECENDRSSHG